MLANDGAQALDSRRDDWFLLPFVGDRVVRAQLLVQPFGKSKSRLRGLFLALNIDEVIEDAIAVRADGDRANQQVFAVRYHAARERWAGIYYVHRTQTFNSPNGPFLRAHVIDGAFDFDWRSKGAGLRLQGEALAIFGRTDLAPTPDHPEHDVVQAAGAIRARWDSGPTGLRTELDAGMFSGDDNLDDARVSGFKANINFQQGILLFAHVLGWQSGRARITASDPDFVGYPAQDLDRLTTGGSVTSAITVFPKVGYKISDSLELYGGALLAFSPQPLIDPFSTRAVGGGSPRNYLGKAPQGSMLGTELDLGAVATLTPNGLPVMFRVRAEYAVLAPGGVMDGIGDDGPIHGGRLTLQVLSAPKAGGVK